VFVVAVLSALAVSAEYGIWILDADDGTSPCWIASLPRGSGSGLCDTRFHKTASALIERFTAAHPLALKQRLPVLDSRHERCQLNQLLSRQGRPTLRRRSVCGEFVEERSNLA